MQRTTYVKLLHTLVILRGCTLNNSSKSRYRHCCPAALKRDVLRRVIWSLCKTVRFKKLEQIWNLNRLKRSLSGSAREASKTDLAGFARSVLKRTMWAFDLLMLEIERRERKKVDSRKEFTTARELLDSLQYYGYRDLVRLLHSYFGSREKDRKIARHR